MTIFAFTLVFCAGLCTGVSGLSLWLSHEAKKEEQENVWKP